MSEPSASGRVHASAVAIGEAGILIRGLAGSGKSSLALALIAAASASGRFARLVGDDRIVLTLKGGRLVARPVAPLEGLVERRGFGLTPVPYLPAATIALVVDLSPEDGARLPEPEALVATVEGVDLPRLPLRWEPGRERLVLAALALFGGAESLDRDKF